MRAVTFSSGALTVSDVNSQVNHEPRVPDLRLAGALGFADPHMIRRLIERHRSALERFGEVSVTATETSDKGGRPGKTYWLSKRQALYLCTKSEAPLATETTIQMVEVFDAWASDQIARNEPPALRAGLMYMMVAGEVVLVDAADYTIGAGQKAVVCGHDGKISIQRGPLEPNLLSPWLGKRSVAGRWRKSKVSGATKERSFYTVIGRLISADRDRRKMLPH